MPALPPIVVHEVTTGTAVAAFRIVSMPAHSRDQLRECFTSSFARERRPRGVERRAIVIQMGLSMFERADDAAVVARRFPAIGSLVARLVLEPGHGFCWAKTGPSGHLTVWGRALEFVQAIVAIEAVDAYG